MLTPKKPKTPKTREDVNTMAARIVAEAAGITPKSPDPDAGKDPAAVARGGEARANGRQGTCRKPDRRSTNPQRSKSGSG